MSDVFAHELCVFMIYGVRFSGPRLKFGICACTRCWRLCWLTCCVVVGLFCASLLAGFAVGDRFVTFSCKPRTYKSNLSRSLWNEVVTVFLSDPIRFELIFDCHTIVTWNDAMHELCPAAPYIPLMSRSKIIKIGSGPMFIGLYLKFRIKLGCNGKI